MKLGKIILRVLIVIFVVLCLALIAAIGSLLYLRSAGEKSLYANAVSKRPSLKVVVIDGKNPETETDGSTVNDKRDEYDEDVVFYNGEPYKYNEDILTFLVMGIDNGGKLPGVENVSDYMLGGQADTLFLVVVNPHTSEIKLIAINRNSMTEVEIYDSDNNYVRTELLQVCLQHGYGSGLKDSCERQVKAVSVLFYELPIHGYISLNLSVIPILNDSVGGVTLEVLENIPKGSAAIANGKGNVVTLKGDDARAYLQHRDMSIFDSSSMRLARQKQYLGAFANQAIAMTKKDITFPLTLFKKMSDYMVTSIGLSEVTYMATTYIDYSFNASEIYSLQGETIVNSGGFEEFHVDDDALYDLMINVFYEKVE